MPEKTLALELPRELFFSLPLLPAKPVPVITIRKTVAGVVERVRVGPDGAVVVGSH